MVAKLAASFVLFAALCAALPARAQVSDGIAECVWLKLKAKASGLEIEDNQAGLGAKHGLSATCYMQLNYSVPDVDNVHGRYGAPVLCQTDFETWSMTSLGESYEGVALGDGNVTSEDNFITFQNDGGDVIQGFMSSRLLITVDKMGAFKKATLTTFSGELTEDSMDFATFTNLFGSFSVKGSSLPAEKVPAEAKALVAGGPCP